MSDGQGLESREPDFTKGSLKQTTARHQRAYELLRDFTPPRSPQNGLDKALAGKSDHRPELVCLCEIFGYDKWKWTRHSVPREGEMHRGVNASS